MCMQFAKIHLISEVKQSDDISAEDDNEKNIDVISRLIYYGVKTLS